MGFLDILPIIGPRRALESQLADLNKRYESQGHTIRALEGRLQYTSEADGIAGPSRIKYPSAIESSRHLYVGDWLGGSLIDLIIDFTVGEGISAAPAGKDDGSSARLMELWEAWWTDPSNQLEKKFKQYCEHYYIDGALPLARAFDTEGNPSYAWNDPVAVKEIIYDEVDPTRILGIVFRVNHKDRVHAVIQQIGDESRAEQVVAILAKGKEDPPAYAIPDPSEEKRAGTLFYFARGSLINTRGVPLLFRAFNFLLDRQGTEPGQRSKGLQTLIYEMLQLRVNAMNLVLNIPSPPGKADEKASAFRERWLKNGAMRMLFVEEGQEAKFTNPTLGSAETAQDVKTVVRAVAASVGLPAFWFNVTDDVNRALSEHASDPAVKRLSAYQAELIGIAREMFEDFLDHQERLGNITEAERAEGYVIKGPDISAKSVAEFATALRTVLDAFNLDLPGIIDRSTREEITAQLVSNLGVEFTPGDRTNEADALLVNEILGESDQNS